MACILASCGSDSKWHEHVDSLNDAAHSWRYRNIDSLRHYATMALEQCPDDYSAGRAEALNHLAYERAQVLDFDSAMAILRQVLDINEAPTEQAIADVMAMKIAQRTSDNIAFFTHRAHAKQRIDDRRRHTISDHESRRLAFAEGEAHIIASTYFYYVDQLQRARNEIDEAEPFCQMQTDTAQWLNYCYMRGSGGLIDTPDNEAVVRAEFDFLFKCFTFSKNNGYVYFEANALQSLATLLADSVNVGILRDHKPDALIYLGIIFPEMSSQVMADEAVCLFQDFDDAFQTACALRTVGTLASNDGRYDDAIAAYREALRLVDGERVPEWEAGIWEKMSVALAGQGMLPESADARNRYLDLRYRTREDAEWASRADLLHDENERLHNSVMATVALAIVLALMLLLLRRWWLRRNIQRLQRATEAHRQLMAEAERRTTALSDAEEALREEREATLLRIQRLKRQNVAQRAKLSLAREIIPLLDRIIHAARRMLRDGQPNANALQYICELTERIDQNGQLLTDWIQMERGRVSLSISTFQLEPLMQTLRRSAFTFSQQGITLDVPATTLSVKADRALTLFMLNTLADNARKFTPRNGRVAITATEGSTAEGQYVELSVSDTGCGLTDEQRQTVLSGRGELHDGHGFGLMNCRGIIERYRKTSRHFAVAAIGVDSTPGSGSRFWFRLPKAVAVAITAMLWLLTTQARPEVVDGLRDEAYRLTDSLYYANVDGRHADALRLAAEAMAAASRWHNALTAATDSARSADTLAMSLQPVGGEAPDVIWLLRGDSIDYGLLLALRNEAAVAALATRCFDIYTYNNHVYTRLFKLYSQDHTLEADCQRLEEAQQWQRAMLWLMLTLIAVAVAMAYLFWLRPRMRVQRAIEELRQQRFRSDLDAQHKRERRQQTDVEMAEDEHRRRLYEESRLHVQNQIMENCLSTIKHETLYYPSRIRRLAQQAAAQQATTLPHATTPDDTLSPDTAASLLPTLAETATYCREVYSAFIAQGEQQAAQVPFRIARVAAADIRMPSAVTAWQIPKGLYVRADAELTEMLLSVIVAYERHLMPEAHITIEAVATDRFVRFAVTNPEYELTESQANDFFSPRHDAYEMLICKQIIRETDMLLGHVGCRIQADPTPDAHGHTLWFTLPKA